VATTPSKRLPRQVLDEDRQTLLTLQTLTDYSPRNTIISTSELKLLAQTLTEAEEAEVFAQRALEVARERATVAGLAFHDGMLAAKVAVKDQYGADSPALHAIGYKQKSERSRPTRRETTSA
jgi:hypothetical protein